MHEQDSQLLQQLNKLEYISHWISTQTLTSSLRKPQASSSTSPSFREQGKKFLKLRKFNPQNFSRKHEITLNHLFMQRIYLILFAFRYQLKLEISQNYFEDNGFIFRVYQLNRADEKSKVKGVEMIEEMRANSDQFQMQVQIVIDQYIKYVEKLKFLPEDQYRSLGNIKKYLEKSEKDKNVDNFLKFFQSWPLTQHYVFNVKLKNALLLPTVQKVQKISNLFKKIVKQQRQFFEKIQKLEQKPSNDFSQFLQVFQQKLKQIFEELKNLQKISEVKINFIKPGTKKGKQVKQLTITANCRVVLSPFRGKSQVKQQKTMSEPTIQRTQIKPQQVEPISGNLISVQASWQFSPVDNSMCLKVQCFNNRKLQPFYFDQILQFWSHLLNHQPFHDLLGIQKFILCQKQPNKQVSFRNRIPFSLPSTMIKQVDKIIALAVSMDQIIEIGERKGKDEIYGDGGIATGRGGNGLWGGYVVEQVCEKYRRALGEIQGICGRYYY